MSQTQRFSTCESRPPRVSPDDLPGVGWDLKKTKVVSVWIYTAMQSKFITSMSVTEFWVKCFAVISCSYFPIINSLSNRISSLLVLHLILCFLGRFICWSKSPFLSLVGLIFRLSIYYCHHQYSIIFFL